MEVVGFDAGNSESTLTWQGSSGLRHVTAPSFVGSGRLEELKRVRSAVGSGALSKDEQVLVYRGASFYVGRLAIEEARDATAARNDVSRYWNGHTLYLLLTLAAQAGISGPVRVMTGLPVSAWNTENKRAIQRAFVGTHEYTINGKARVLTIDAVGVMMEGAAALASYGLSDVPQAVVDIGGRTTDLFWAFGARPLVDRCTAVNVGVESAADILKRQTLETHRRELHPIELRNVLRAHVSGQAAPRVFGNGREIVLNGAVGSAIQTVGAQIVSQIAARWGDDRGVIASEAARVVLIGGGAYYFADMLRAAISHIEVARLPELANALGYLSVGLSASEDAWQRNRGA